MKKLRSTLKNFLKPLHATITEKRNKEYIISTNNPLVQKGIQILDQESSLEYLLQHKINLARFGDGEFSLINKSNSIGFQSINNRLAKKLHEVLNAKTNPSFKIAIPYRLINVNNVNANSAQYWSSYVRNNGDSLIKIISNNTVYLDASITRCYITGKNIQESIAFIQKFKKLWDKQDLLIVEGEYTRNGVDNDLFENAKSISRLICPSKNAFDKYEEILEAIKIYGKNKLVLGSLGPTASLLAYDLIPDNIWFIDLGHLDLEYMWCLKNTPERIPIKGRLINELDQKNQDLELTKESFEMYQNSIRQRIS